MGEARRAPALTLEHPLPQRVGITVERIVGVDVADEPRVDDQLTIELAWTPSRIAGEKTELVDRGVGTFEVILQVEAPQGA